MADTERPGGPTGGAVSLKEAAGLLGVDEARVVALGRQGRLEVVVESGKERRYRYASVLDMRSENLIREMTEKARESCPELETQINELAAAQFERGQVAGQELFLKIL